MSSGEEVSERDLKRLAEAGEIAAMEATTVSEPKTVRMEVTVTVEPPVGQTLTDEQAIELAMSSVTQLHHVECGRDAGPHYDKIAWAKVFAEVADCDCEVIE